MTERDIESLKKLPVPAPREGARRAALDAAMNAFDESSAAETTTKGIEALGRPTPAPHPAVRRKLMSFTRTQYAMAASVAALMIAAPAAFHVFDGARHERPLYGSKTEPAAPPLVDADVDRNALGEGQGAKSDTKGGESATTTVRSLTKEKTAVAQAEPAGDRQAKEARSEDEVAATRPEAVVGSPAAENAPGRMDDSANAARDFGVLATEPGANRKDAMVADKPATGHVIAGRIQSGANGTTSSEDQRLDPKKLERSRIDSFGAVGGYPLPTDGARGGHVLAAPPPPAPVASVQDLAKLYAPEVRLPEADQRSTTNEEFRDKFDTKEMSPVKQVAAEPVSTFSIDVDTASYAFVRRSLNGGVLPPKDAVRVEEMINYFPYDYPRPESAATPFQPTVTVMPSPWNPSNQLVHIAIKGYELKSVERPRANLVFLIDVSGSMEPADKLPLVRNAFRMLLDELKSDDTVAIVTYASGSGVALEPTKVSEKGKILAAIDRLGAGGSTAGAQGIQDAYRLAEASYDKSAVNRVILATDGDFNVGVTDQGDLKDLIERKREKGIFLSILGVGQGNYNDALMQTLAQNGNGTAAYVDTLNEARKVLVDEASSTLFTIAKDVKAQIEWNPARVSEYRLIGYETRTLKREDFNNDQVDAGDIGSGHTVTAIYEVTPVGAPQLVDSLRYQKGPQTASAKPLEPAAGDGELGFLKLRFKLPKEDASKLVTLPITDALGKDKVDDAPQDARFSVAVAAFGQLLSGSPYLKSFGYDDVISLAQGARGEDRFGYRAEFMNLVRLAKSARP